MDNGSTVNKVVKVVGIGLGVVAMAVTTQSDLIALITAAVGIIISLATTFAKPIAEWFYSIPENYRGLSMIGLNLLGAVAVFAISCSGLFTWVACTKESAVDLLRAFLFMLGTNQLVYMASPESPTKIAMREAAIHDALTR